MMQAGMRKFILGIIFMGCATFLTWRAIEAQPPTDLYGIMACIGGLTSGLGVIVYGNVKEHQAQAKADAKGN